MNVGLDALHRVVFGGRHLLEGGGVNHVVHALHGLSQPVAVAHVTNEVAHAVLRELLLHLRLLELVAGVDDELPRAEAIQDRPNVLLPERSGATGDQNALVVEHVDFLARAGFVT